MDDRVDLGAGAGAGRSASNHVSGLAQFLKKWDAKRRIDISIKNARGAGGHVNLEGSAACFTSHIFTPADPEFVDAIEAGVRDLVLLLIDDLNCITYSSCEGHAPVGQNPLRQRHVGVLPRNAEEYDRLLQRFRSAADATHRNCQCETVRVHIKEALITTDGPDVRCIDILFAAVTSDWAAYSRSLEPAYREFLTCLEHSQVPKSGG
jgi:hypothetical protein